MAVTSASDIAGIIDASATLAATITGIKRVYDRVGEIPPVVGANDLPAILQSVTASDLPPATHNYSVGSEYITHYWYLDVLVHREGDTHAEQAALMPFIPLVRAKFVANVQLNQPQYVRECLPQNHRFITLTFGDEAFAAVRFLMRCRASSPVQFTDPA